MEATIPVGDTLESPTRGAMLFGRAVLIWRCLGSVVGVMLTLMGMAARSPMGVFIGVATAVSAFQIAKSPGRTRYGAGVVGLGGAFFAFCASFGVIWPDFRVMGICGIVLVFPLGFVGWAFLISEDVRQHIEKIRDPDDDL